MKDRDPHIIGKNLKFLRKQKGLTQQELADQLEIRRSSIGAYEECRATPKYDTLQGISEFFGMSIDLLVKEDIGQLEPDQMIGPQEQRRLDLEGRRLRVLPVTVDNTGNENVEFVPQKATAGYLAGYSDPEFIEDLPKFAIPTLRGGTYRAFEISGDSMLPLRPGTIVIGEYVQDWLRDLREGQTYVVVSKDDGVVYKRVFSRLDREGGELELRSDNPAYPPYAVPADSIQEMWKAKMYVSSDFPEPDISIERLTGIVMDLQKEVMRLRGSESEN